MKNKENKDLIYCVFCGEENNLNDKTCTKCKKELDPKSKVYEEYILSNTKDNLKTSIETNILTLIKKYIQSHLYGAVVLGSIVFTVTSATINTNKEINYKTIDEIPTHYEVNIISTYNKTNNKQNEILGKYAQSLLEKKENPNKYKLSVNKPEVYKQLKAKYDNTFNTIQTSEDLEYLTSKPITYKNYVSGIIYDKEGSDLKGNGIIDGYEFNRFIIEVMFCGYNNCEANSGTLYIRYVVEAIKVDDEWFISGTKRYSQSVEEDASYEYFERRNFDSTNNNLYGKKYEKIECSSFDECVRKQYED